MASYHQVMNPPEIPTQPERRLASLTLFCLSLRNDNSRYTTGFGTSLASCYWYHFTQFSQMPYCNLQSMLHYRYDRANIWDKATPVWRIREQSECHSTVSSTEGHSESELSWPRKIRQTQQSSVCMQFYHRHVQCVICYIVCMLLYSVYLFHVGNSPMLYYCFHGHLLVQKFLPWWSISVNLIYWWNQLKLTTEKKQPVVGTGAFDFFLSLTLLVGL